VVADLVGDIAEDRRRDGQIEGPHDVLPLVEQLLQIFPALVRLGVDGNVVDALQELRDFGLIQLLGLQVLVQRIQRELSVFLMCHRRARGTNDTGRFRQLTRELAMEQGRQKLPLGQVAGAAEDDIVKGFNGDDLAAHAASLVRQIRWTGSNLIDLKKPPRRGGFCLCMSRQG